MPVAAADGILGIEALHKWIDTTTSSVLATLGDLTVWPRYDITDIAGLYDFPDIEDNSEPKTEAIGVVSYPGRARAKNATYTIDVQGQTLQEMRAGGAALRAAFGPDISTGIAAERLMIVTPHASYGTQEHAFVAKCLQFAQGTDVQTKGPNAFPCYVRSVVIGLRLYDPRIYEWDPESEFGLVNPKW